MLRLAVLLGLAVANVVYSEPATVWLAPDHIERLRRPTPVADCEADQRMRGQLSDNPFEPEPTLVEPEPTLADTLMQQISDMTPAGNLQEPFCWYRQANGEVLLRANSFCGGAVEYHFRPVKSDWSMLRVALYSCDPTNSESLNEQFVDIRKTLEANCGDCYPRSKQDFVHAVGELKALIFAGMADTEAAKALADAYRTWAFTYAADSQETEALLRKELAICTDLIKRAPQDPAIWAAYARSLADLGDLAKSLDALKQAEALSPDDASIQFSMGMLYAHGLNDPEEGIAHLQRAIELEQGPDRMTYGEQLARVFESKGEKAKAAKVRADMKAFEQKLESRDASKQPRS